jgi:hypothetical protein
MSNELRINFAAIAEKGDFKWSFNPGQIQSDMSVGARVGHCQLIGTSATMLDLGTEALDALGYMVLRNLDDTNYIDFGPYDGGSAGTLVIIGRIMPGEIAVLRLSASVTVGAQANSAACYLDVNLLSG